MTPGLGTVYFYISYTFLKQINYYYYFLLPGHSYPSHMEAFGRNAETRSHVIYIYIYI